MWFRMMTIFGSCLMVGLAWADSWPASVTWPGWHVETNEIYDARGYPITWMFDGNPGTAWVFSFKPDKIDDSNNSHPQKNHGIGAGITITKGNPRDDENRDPFDIDGIGIINGYTKSHRLYWRNNRIVMLNISVKFPESEQTWSKDFTLQDSFTMQKMQLPHLEADSVTLTVKNVEVGIDDDLCISELAFYNQGKQIPWNLTPYVIYRLGGDANYDFTLDYGIMNSKGHEVRKNYWGDMKDHHLLYSFAWQPGSSNVLLATENHLYLYNLRTNGILSHHNFSGPIQNLGWLSTKTAFIGVEHGYTTQELLNLGNAYVPPFIWYRIDFPADKIQRILVKTKEQGDALDRKMKDETLPGSFVADFGGS